MSGDKNTESVQTLVTPKMASELKEEAEIMGHTLSGYIRWLLEKREAIVGDFIKKRKSLSDLRVGNLSHLGFGVKLNEA